MFKTYGLSTLAPLIMYVRIMNSLLRSDFNELRLLPRILRLRRQESGIYAYNSMSISLFYAIFITFPTSWLTLYQ